MFQAKLCFSGKVLFNWSSKSIKANGKYPLFYQRVQLL